MDRTAIIEQVLERARIFPGGRAYFWTSKGSALPTELTAEEARTFG